MADRSRNDEQSREETSENSAATYQLPIDNLSRRNVLAGAGGLGGILFGASALSRRTGGSDDGDESNTPRESEFLSATEPTNQHRVETVAEDEFVVTDPALEAHIDRHDLPAPPNLSDIDTQRTRDAVDDIGLDPSGSEPIQNRLENALRDGDRIEFPSGSYRLSGHLNISGHSNFALVGTGDVTFVVDSGLTRTVLSYRNCRDCAFVGIDIDQSASNCSAQTAFNISGRLVVTDVEFLGWSDPDDSGKKIAFNVRDSSGVARFERVIANDGTEVGRSGVDHNNVHKQQYDGAYWAGPPHEGTAYLINCEAAHWSDNGLYASRTNGGIIVSGGYYANSSISQVRLGHPESFVGNGCHMLIDRDQIPDEHNPSGLAFTRGIWLESGSLDNPGATVGQCFIEVGSVGSFGGCINVAPSASNAVIEGTVEVIAPSSIDRLNARTSVDVADGAIQDVDSFSEDPNDGGDGGGGGSTDDEEGDDGNNSDADDDNPDNSDDNDNPDDSELSGCGSIGDENPIVTFCN